MAADRNALRRLNTLLADETYGPALARLRGEDERRVLQAVSENRGADARREILAADQRRRERVRVQRHTALFRRAVDNVAARHAARPRDVEKHLANATEAELRFAAGADRDQLIQRAREAPRTLEGRDINPFWYH